MCMNKYLIILLLLILSLLCSCNNNDYNQWAIYNNGEYVHGVSGVKSIDISLPNKKPLKMTSNHALIAIVDDMIDFSNNKLSGLKSEDSNYTSTNTNSEHGTAVAGIITTNNNSDNYISILKNAKIYPILINTANIDIDQLIINLGKAEESGVRVVNMSLAINKYSDKLYNFIKNSKMLFVCAGGNDNSNKLDFPSSINLENVISVVGINSSGYIGSNSNFSKEANISAPSENILCISNNKLKYLSGTSFATPFVTATCAYIIDNTGFDSVKTKQFLLNNAYQLNSIKDYVSNGNLLSISKVINNLNH